MYIVVHTSVHHTIVSRHRTQSTRVNIIIYKEREKEYHMYKISPLFRMELVTTKYNELQEQV